jgi:hypothetical protein
MAAVLEPVVDVSRVKTEVTADPFMADFLAELLVDYQDETFESMFSDETMEDTRNVDDALLGVSSCSSNSDAGYSGYSSDSHGSDISTVCGGSPEPTSPEPTSPFEPMAVVPVSLPMSTVKPSLSSSAGYNKSKCSRTPLATPKNTKKRGASAMKPSNVSEQTAVAANETRAPPPVMKAGMTKAELSKLRREARKVRNRESANRSRMKRLHYTSELENELSEKNALIAQLQAQLQAALENNTRLCVSCSSSETRRTLALASSSLASSATSSLSSTHAKRVTDTSSLGIANTKPAKTLAVSVAHPFNNAPLLETVVSVLRRCAALSRVMLLEKEGKGNAAVVPPVVLASLMQTKLLLSNPSSCCNVCRILSAVGCDASSCLCAPIVRSIFLGHLLLFSTCWCFLDCPSCPV